MLRFSALFVIFTILFGFFGCIPKDGLKADDPQEQITIKLFANLLPAEAGIADQEFLMQIKKDTGIKVEFEIPPYSSYNDRLQLMLASGDYPDAVLFLSTSQQSYRNAVESEIIIPVNDYLENAPNLLKYTYDFSWEALRYYQDERIFGIPRTSLARNDGMAVRTDWLDNVGIPFPQDNGISADEFYEILRRFTYDDPDGDGRNDTYGMAFYGTQNKRYGPASGTGALFGNIGWQKYEGSDFKYIAPEYSRTLPIFKQQLAYSAKLERDGLIDPDGPMLTETQVDDKFYSGKIGVKYAFPGHVLNMEEWVKSGDEHASVGILFMKGPSGKIEGSSFSTGHWGQWCIMKGSKHPEAIVRVFDYILSAKGWDSVINGMEGVNYTIKNGAVIKNEVEESAWARNLVRRKDDFNFFTGTNKRTSEEKLRIEKMFCISQDTLVFSLDGGFNPSVVQNIEFINQAKKMDEGISKITTGVLPPESYDQLLEGWYKAKGREYVLEMNEYIEKRQNMLY